MYPKTRYFIDGHFYTKTEVATQLKLKPATVAKRMKSTPQPWTWNNIRRAKKQAGAIYRIEGKLYTVREVAARLEISLHAARGRIYERLESHGRLTWDHLKRNMRGSTPLRRLLIDKPGAAMIRKALNDQAKTISWLAGAIGVENKEYIRRVIAGERVLTPEMAKRVAEVLMLDADEERQLHIAGAKQAGWDV